MDVTSELSAGSSAEVSDLHRAVADLRTTISDVRARYGDIPAVRRLLGDVERLDLDASELDGLTPASTPSSAPAQEFHLIDDRPHDPSLWADADDEGLGGYQRGGSK